MGSNDSPPNVKDAIVIVPVGPDVAGGDVLVGVRELQPETKKTVTNNKQNRVLSDFLTF
ncbi:MAG: hypothetical protein NUK65_02750 [Firmicutes bacterium]|nr:hypothetical protein [Bacillota bacterium]